MRLKRTLAAGCAVTAMVGLAACSSSNSSGSSSTSSSSNAGGTSSPTTKNLVVETSLVL